MDTSVINILIAFQTKFEFSFDQRPKSDGILLYYDKIRTKHYTVLQKTALLNKAVVAVTHFVLAQGVFPINELPPPVDL